jgi:hypothetical protein
MALSWVCQVNSAVRLSSTWASAPHTRFRRRQRGRRQPRLGAGPPVRAAGLDGMDQGRRSQITEGGERECDRLGLRGRDPVLVQFGDQLAHLTDAAEVGLALLERKLLHLELESPQVERLLKVAGEIVCEEGAQDGDDDGGGDRSPLRDLRHPPPPSGR